MLCEIICFSLRLSVYILIDRFGDVSYFFSDSFTRRMLPFLCKKIENSFMSDFLNNQNNAMIATK